MYTTRIQAFDTVPLNLNNGLNIGNAGVNLTSSGFCSRRTTLLCAVVPSVSIGHNMFGLFEQNILLLSYIKNVWVISGIAFEIFLCATNNDCKFPP